MLGIEEVTSQLVYNVLFCFQSSLHTNEKAVVKFHFINRPEYIRVGSRLLFREGRTKGMGEVTEVIPYGENIPNR